MEIADFELERYFARWEFAVAHLLCASDPEPVPMGELLAMADPQTERLWADLRLGYTESVGHPLLRAEIARSYQTVDPDQVLVCSGAQEAIFVSLGAMLGPGDHAVVVWPSYQAERVLLLPGSVFGHPGPVGGPRPDRAGEGRAGAAARARRGAGRPARAGALQPRRLHDRGRLLAGGLPPGPGAGGRVPGDRRAARPGGGASRVGHRAGRGVDAHGRRAGARHHQDGQGPGGPPRGPARGVTSGHVLAVELALPGGELVRLGAEGPEAPGYDLRGLVVGSEGTLGIVTAICVRLTPIAPAVRTMLLDFPTVADAAATVAGVVAAGVVPAAMELLDRRILEVIEPYVHAGYPT